MSSSMSHFACLFALRRLSSTRLLLLPRSRAAASSSAPSPKPGLLLSDACVNRLRKLAEEEGGQETRLRVTVSTKKETVLFVVELKSGFVNVILDHVMT